MVIARDGWTPGTWWRAPADQRFYAYYLNLRTNYGMPAREAFAYAKSTHAQWPAFMTDPISTLRNAIAAPR